MYISTSDYSSIRSDGGRTLTVTVPASTVVAGSGTYSISSSVELGGLGAGLRAQIESSKDSGKRYVGLWQDRFRIGTESGFPATYDIFVVLSRSSATTLTLTATVFNPYAGALTCAAGAETFTAYVRTLVSPFEEQ